MRTTLATLVIVVLAACTHPQVRVSSPSIDLALLQDAVEPAPPATPPPAGGLSRAEISAVYAAVMNDIKGCYERALARNRDLAGTVKTESVIGGDGKVQSAAIAESTLNDPEAESCILVVIKGLQFPQPVGGGRVFVTYPFVFSSSDPPPPRAKARVGGLSREQVAAVYAPAMKDIKGCYERGLRRKSDLAGTVTTRSIIKSDGSVMLAEVDASTLRDAEVEACVIDIIKALEFPKPEGGGQVLITYPFVFSAARESPQAAESRGACGFP